MESNIIPFYQLFDKFIVKATGCEMYDSEGKKYIDFESGDWAANLGHSPEKLNQLISQQAATLLHDGLRFRNKQSEDLANLLAGNLGMPGGKCAFLNSGSEAVNLAILIAKNFTKRDKILKLDCSYLAAFGHGQISAANNNLINISIDDFTSLDKLDFKGVAAFVFEPGNAWGLIKFPTNDFIKAVSKRIKETGGYLIANEVTTGFGRTGKWFGFQHYDYTPDIVSVGKGLGNGYPISGVSITKEVSQDFEKNPFRYAQSHQNDPLGCAIGCEVINIFEEQGLIQASLEKGNYFLEQFLQLQAKHKSKVKEVRGRGLMLAMELETGINAENIYIQLIDKGFLVGCKNNVLRFMPPLIIEKSQIDQMIGAIEGFL